MITTIALLKARPGIAHDEFVDHYENHHVPLILSLAPAPTAYSRTYLPAPEERGAEADFDVMTRLQFEDKAAREAWIAQVYAPGSGVAEDEATFLDRTRTRSWVVDEHVTTVG
ncbi:EthD domain-containing protein [Streptomyces sp. NPDC091219]|uniref:EthD domain-containing protein n=1 Tax=Streptomyces sp. NPDC091219 TaxID=3155193 RepID=UPI00344C7394